MAVFAFKAHDKRTNKEISDQVEAGTEVEAIATIKRRGFLPIEVKELRAKSGKTAASGDKRSVGGFALFGGVKPKQVTLFTRQLSTLQDAGLPIVQSMQILTDMQRPGAFKSALTSVTEDVANGTQLSEAMSRFPRIWDRLYTNLCKAGETAGALDTVLRRLADFREKSQRLPSRLAKSISAWVSHGSLIPRSMKIASNFGTMKIMMKVRMPQAMVSTAAG